MSVDKPFSRTLLCPISKTFTSPQRKGTKIRLGSQPIVLLATASYVRTAWHMSSQSLASAVRAGKKSSATKGYATLKKKRSWLKPKLVRAEESSTNSASKVV